MKRRGASLAKILPIISHISETVQEKGKLILYSLIKSRVWAFQLVPKSVALNDFERRNGPVLRYFAKFGTFLGPLRKSG